MHSYFLYMLRRTLQLYRFERWNVTDEMINQAKTDYIAVSGPDAVGKREPLKKTGLAGSISAFLAATAPELQVSPVVALHNMIRWGNFQPDGLFCYHVGNTLSGAKAIMCVSVSTTWPLVFNCPACECTACMSFYNAWCNVVQE
jgi:hypothetical protein